MQVLSFDIGGTKIAAAVVNEYGEILGEITKIPTADSVQKIVEDMQAIIKAHEFDGLAIATAGVVNNNKITRKPLNIPHGYEKIDFSAFADVPYIIENDANAAAWYEYKIGAAENCQNAIVLALGTGVGCGIISEGKLLKGKSGAAGECPFEISGTDLAELAKAKGISTDCFEIYNSAKLRNPAAMEVYNIWYGRLFEALCCLNDLFDTQKIVLVGSLAHITNCEDLQSQINLASFGEPPIICKTKGHIYSALVGAALLWYDKYKQGA